MSPEDRAAKCTAKRQANIAAGLTGEGRPRQRKLWNVPLTQDEAVDRHQRIVDSHKRYRDRNPGKVHARTYRRKAATRQSTPRWLTPEQHTQINNWYLLGRATERHVDHIEPLIGENVCGLHVPWNMRLLLPGENCRKGNTPNRGERRAHMLRVIRKN